MIHGAEHVSHEHVTNVEISMSVVRVHVGSKNIPHIVSWYASIVERRHVELFTMWQCQRHGVSKNAYVRKDYSDTGFV